MRHEDLEERGRYVCHLDVQCPTPQLSSVIKQSFSVTSQHRSSKFRCCVSKPAAALRHSRSANTFNKPSVAAFCCVIMIQDNQGATYDRTTEANRYSSMAALWKAAIEYAVRLKNEGCMSSTNISFPRWLSHSTEWSCVADA